MPEQVIGSPAKRRRLSLLSSTRSGFDGVLDEDELRHKDHTSHEHGGEDDEEGQDTGIAVLSTSRLAGKAVAPFLTKHIQGQDGKPQRSWGPEVRDPSLKYCYRHRPDLKCRRQADEPTMDQLQRVRKTNHHRLSPASLEADSPGRNSKPFRKATNKA
jgi:F-box and WD-40 domain protein MET30